MEGSDEGARFSFDPVTLTSVVWSVRFSFAADGADVFAADPSPEFPGPS